VIAPDPHHPQHPQPSPHERGVLEVLNDVKSGAVTPRSLHARDRKRCVEYLLGEGVSVPEIAQLFKRTERTIRRDIDSIRAANALVVDEEFAPRMAGELVNEVRASIARIRRTTRDKDCPHTVRIDGERAVVEAMDRLLARLQLLGYLPTATQRFQGDLTHRLGAPIEFGDILVEAKRLRATIPSTSTPSPELAAIETLAADLTQLDAPAPLSDTTGAEEAPP